MTKYFHTWLHRSRQTVLVKNFMVFYTLPSIVASFYHRWLFIRNVQAKFKKLVWTLSSFFSTINSKLTTNFERKRLVGVKIPKLNSTERRFCGDPAHIFEIVLTKNHPQIVCLCNIKAHIKLSFKANLLWKIMGAIVFCNNPLQLYIVL